MWKNAYLSTEDPKDYKDLKQPWAPMAPVASASLYRQLSDSEIAFPPYKVLNPRMSSV